MSRRRKNVGRMTKHDRCGAGSRHARLWTMSAWGMPGGFPCRLTSPTPCCRARRDSLLWRRTGTDGAAARWCHHSRRPAVDNPGRRCAMGAPCASTRPSRYGPHSSFCHQSNRGRDRAEVPKAAGLPPRERPERLLTEPRPPQPLVPPGCRRGSRPSSPARSPAVAADWTSEDHSTDERESGVQRRAREAVMEAAPGQRDPPTIPPPLRSLRPHVDQTAAP